jgi:tripartite-type tricarboxylate transporter receptor subunit TctC
MALNRRRVLKLTLAAGPIAGVGASAHDFPRRPVRWLVGFPPGGGASLATRLMADWLSRRLGQPVLIENRPGASGALAIQEGVKAASDGHTLILVPASAVILPRAGQPPAGFLADLEPLSGLVTFALVLLASPQTGLRSLPDLIAAAKARAGELNFASFGLGSTSHLSGELLQLRAGIKLNHVPYQGESAAFTDLMVGRVQLMFGVLTSSLPHIEAGTVQALGVATQERHPLAPEVPAIRETLEGFEVSSWMGVGLPRGTPASVVSLLNQEINNGLNDPGLRSRYMAMAASPLILSPKGFGEYITTQIGKWGNISLPVGRD